MSATAELVVFGSRLPILPKINLEYLLKFRRLIMIGNSNLLAEQVISTFSFNNNSIRCILINGDPWFCLKEDLTLGDNNDCNFYCGMVN